MKRARFATATALALGAALSLGISACTETNPAYLIWKDGGGNQNQDAADGGASDAGGGDGAAGDASDAPVACASNDACTGDPRGPYCHLPSGACVGCTVTDHCRADGGAQVCDPAAHACVQCVGDGDCGGGLTPVCEAHACRACKADSECKSGPGICVRDGHCATDGEVVYVKNPPNCATTGNGTAAAPYCDPQNAIISLTTSGKSIVVITGPESVTGLTLLAQPPGVERVTVVGRAGAAVAPGGSPGIRLANGVRMHVRDLIINKAENVGVRADTGSALEMERCLVQGNTKGGIVVDMASFDITNSIISGNGAGVEAGGVSFGGVRLGASVAGKPTRFASNTVVGNGQVGIACASAYAIESSVVSGNLGGESVLCALAPCCASADVRVDPTTYHLLAGSSCIDRVPPAMSLPMDIDGQARPQGAMSDCGADEYAAGP